MSVWLVLIFLVVAIQWAYFVILSVALFTNHRNFETQISATVENRDLHGRFKQDILKFYIDKSEELDNPLTEDQIEIERDKGADKPSRVTLNPSFKRDFLFGIVLSYESPIVLDIPTIKGETR